MKSKFLSDKALIILVSLLALLMVNFPALVNDYTATSIPFQAIYQIGPDSLETFVDGYVSQEMEIFRVPGLVVVQETDVLLSKGYSYADPENKAPMTPKAAFWAGSVSKPVTVSALFELVAKGLITFQAIGMQNSTYLQPLSEAIFSKLAVGYGFNASTQEYNVVPHDFVRISPGVAWVTIGDDMALGSNVTIEWTKLSRVS